MFQLIHEWFSNCGPDQQDQMSTVNWLEIHIRGPHPRPSQSESLDDRAQMFQVDAEV